MNKTISEMVNVPLIEEPMLDFMDFLRVLRWMLDTNFANINGAAEKAKTCANQRFGLMAINWHSCLFNGH